jgi:hypothetical protein
MIHRRSKIGRLPENIREQINEFLDTHTEYQRILDWLTEQGISGIEMYHLTRWKDTGYLDWLARHEHNQELELKLNWVERLADQGPAALQRGAMTILALKLFDTIARTDSCDMSKLLESRPEKITTLLNCFARFCHESLETTKFHDELQQRAKAATDAQLVDKGAPTAETIKRMKGELRIFFRKLLAAESATKPATDSQPLASTST